MLAGHRSLVIGVMSLLLLAGCGSSSSSSSRGTVDTSGSGTGTTGGNPTGAPTGNPIAGGGGLTGTIDKVAWTASVGGFVSAVVGSSRTLSIAFTSSDGNAISGFGISNSLGTLPAGWSGPSTFTCALVSTGSGCVLNLTFTPTAAQSGSLTLDYVFVDNATLPSTGGTLTIPYSSTAHNNIVAAATPTGQVISVVGDNQMVNVNFTTDDGNAATAFTVDSDLTALPSGWSSTATSLPCAIVSTGSGCQLALSFAPSAAGSGTLTLTYSYTDDSGAVKSGSVNIPYAAKSQGDVVAAASPAGQINAIEKTGGQAVSVNFTTDDGTPAAGLYVMSDLTALPPGWSSASKSFSCASVSTGNGCELHLTYAPAALTSGTLTLNYAYDAAAGTAKTGSLNLTYAATTNDNVAGTAAPTGQINAVVGQGTQAVSVTFTTDDARTATALQLTSSLASLPPGWSSTAAAFACSSVTTGNACQLPLMYVPTAAGSGTLTLAYAYKNNAGRPKTGSVNIAYRATTNDNIVGTPNPSPPLAVAVAGSKAVNITFTTDDGNPASNLLVTSDLSALSSGWSSAAGSFACANVSTGTGCNLGLTYAPTAAATGTLSVTYSYDDDSGTPKAGSVNIPYRATTNDNIVATPNPSPLAVAVASTTPVTITFTTDDGNVANNLSVTTALGALPSGWSSAVGSFACANVSTGTGCSLGLTYAPTAAAAGTLYVTYSYDDDSGTPKIGSVSILYTAM
jgi:hypothetical protein